MAMPPFLVISEATKPMRRMLMSRCSLEKPSSEERFLRTMSPSSSVTGRPPVSMNLTSSTLAMVDLPEPERPVKNTVKPCWWRGGWVRRSSSATSGKVNQAGQVAPFLQPAAQLGAGDVEGPRARRDLVLRHVGVEVLDVETIC